MHPDMVVRCILLGTMRFASTSMSQPKVAQNLTLLGPYLFTIRVQDCWAFSKCCRPCLDALCTGMLHYYKRCQVFTLTWHATMSVQESGRPAGMVPTDSELAEANYGEQAMSLLQTVTGQAPSQQQQQQPASASYEPAALMSRSYVGSISPPPPRAPDLDRYPTVSVVQPGYQLCDSFPSRVIISVGPDIPEQYIVQGTSCVVS